MRRPLLLFLFIQAFAICILFYLNPLGLGTFLLPSGKILQDAGQIVTLEGTVSKVKIKESYAELVLKCRGENVLVKLGVKDSPLRIYDLTGRSISVQGELEIPDGRRNPGCFDYRLYLKGRGIYSAINVSKYRISAGNVQNPLIHFLSVKKGEFFDSVRPYLDDRDFQILAGLLFGETSYMEEDLSEQFRLNGISHILAVSGLHVGLMYSLVLKLLRGRRNVFTSVVILFILFVYSALSNFSISVLRASFMIFLNILAFHLKRRYDLVCAATLTAIIFLFINPYQLFDVGFQLSFTAAYSMGIALPWAESKGIELSDKYRKKYILTLFEIFSPCVMVQLGMTPLILFHYNIFSPVSLLINPPAVALAGLLLPAGLICFIISFIATGSLLLAAAGPAGALSKLLRLLCDAGSYIGGSGYTAAPAFGTLALYYLLFFWFFSETRVTLSRKRRHGTVLAINLFIIGAGLLGPFFLGISEHIIPWKYNTHTVTFLDVGQGDCIHFNIDGYNILVDGGGSIYSNVAEKRLRPYLLKNGITSIDLAIATHSDADHALGLQQLCEIFDVKKMIYVGLTNDDCAVMNINAGDVKTLLMADADIAREETLIKEYPKGLICDILKIGHHGSAYSTGKDLLDAAKPSFAVISCGRNNKYGHPAPRVIELLTESGIIYARTDISGAIYLKKADEQSLLFENAAKDTQWLIQRTSQIQSTPQRQ